MNDNEDPELGDLIAAAFDEAARYSTDPSEVSRLATRALAHILERTQDRSLAEAGELEVPRTLSPGGRRATAAALQLVPREGPKLRLLPRATLRLVPAPTPFGARGREKPRPPHGPRLRLAPSPRPSK